MGKGDALCVKCKQPGMSWLMERCSGGCDALIHHECSLETPPTKVAKRVQAALPMADVAISGGATSTATAKTPSALLAPHAAADLITGEASTLPHWLCPKCNLSETYM